MTMVLMALQQNMHLVLRLDIPVLVALVRLLLY